MKKNISLAIICLVATFLVRAQDSDYKVVFDMTSKDTVNQQALVRQLTLIGNANPGAKLEVVIYGQGLSLAVQGGSSQQAAVSRLLTEKNVVFKVCAMTMKRSNVDKSQLLPGVQVVPDGIYEIISRQKEGWGYIKVAH
jgi:intracellular sulfur oxidation DsrE/DsrF family protein